MKGVHVANIKKYLPVRIYTNEDILKEDSNFNVDKLSIKIGITNRHISAENETALDMAEKVCLDIFTEIDKSTVGFLILCTQSPEYLLPTTACMLQNRLGLSPHIGAFDYNLGCSGYVYGLAMAKSLIKGGMAKKVLLVTSETYSKYIKKEDLVNRSIFGDAATATIVEECEEEMIGNFDFGTDGSGYEKLIIKNGGTRNRLLDGSEADYLFMDGPEIFNFTIENTPITVERVLHKNNCTLDDIDHVFFHQANKFMLDYLRKKIGIKKEKFYIDLQNTGNTVSSTIPIAIYDALEKKIIKKGDKILLTGFGVGYSWCSGVLKI